MPAPALTGFAPSVAFPEDVANASPLLLDADVTFAGGEGFNGGTLTLSGLLAEDRVSVRNQGSGAGQIGLSGANVTFGGVIIGTLAGGVGATLTITFNGSATSAAIDALIQNLTYVNVSDTPTASRDLVINVTDAAGNDLSGPVAFTQRTGAASPFNGVGVGEESTPAFVDLDGDGDLDAILGEYDGVLNYFENTGTALAPVFTQRTGAANPFNGVDVGIWSAPAFVDLDGDGDLDALVGEAYGALLYFENTGTASAPVFTERTGVASPFNGVDLGLISKPTFVDLDGDGDRDAVVGEHEGVLNYFENTGSALAPVFTQRIGAANPFNGVDVGTQSAPAFVDLDGDGDLDALVGEFDGVLNYFENTGSALAPVFTERTGPFNGVDVGIRSTPAFADLDGDGDLDAVVGEYFGTLIFFLNTTVRGQTITVNVTAENDAPTATGLPTDLTVIEDAASNLDLSSVTLTDPDTIGDITVVLTASAGTMTASSGGGVTVANSGTSAITLTGTVSAIDAFLNNASAIQYTGALNASGNDAATVTVTADDGAGAVTLGVVNVDITDVPDAGPPVLTDFGSSITFGENHVNATPQLLDADVTFTDSDGDYDGGFLTLSGLLAEDRVSVRNEGSGAGQIGLSGADVTFGGVVIGTLAGGSGATLTITFNASATSAAIDALIQNLTYANVSDTPTATRNLVLNVTDAAGNDLGASGAPSFTERTGAANPFNGVDVGNTSKPSFADLDGDGDGDALVGANNGSLRYFENTGTASAPAFTERTGAANPFNGVDLGNFSAPAFADLDDDGDLDAVVGEDGGALFYFENIGTALAPVFTQRIGAANPFNGADVGSLSAPTLADLDGDGDLDMVVGENFGTLLYFENTGTVLAPVFTQRTGAANPFNGLDLGGSTTPTFTDLDDDGDLDGVIGEFDGVLNYFENTGTALAPVFTQRTGAANPFNGLDVGIESRPAFADLDGDGDLEALSGERYGTLFYFENTTVRGQTVTVNVTAEPEPEPGPPVLTDFAPSITFAENTVNATPQLLDADVTFTDSDGDYDGGSLTLSGLLAEDSVSVRNQGSGAGQIGLSGADVTFGGVVIGTLAGGSGATLTITFNAAATSAAIDALIQNLTYVNVSDTPTASRDLVLNITDAVGNDLGAAGAPSFTERTGAANPFNGIDVGYRSTPAFADLDGDGDLDVLVGDFLGSLNYFENTGTAAAPVFTQRTGAANSFNGVDVGYRSSPTFVDLDGDGDLDAMVGEFDGVLNYFENTGTAAAPVFTQRTGAANPFNGVDVGLLSTPTLADLDGDGDLDALVGERDNLFYFENTGTAAAPVFTPRTGAANPFNGVSVGFISLPTVADVDGDGDLDALIGEYDGTLNYFENTGTASTPVFTQRTGAANPFNGVDLGYYSNPILADLDGDGDLDAVFGEDSGVLNHFENTTVRGQTVTVNVTAEPEPEPGPPVLTGFAPSITVAENTVNATPQLLDGDVTFTDSDGDYDGGFLTLSGMRAEDTVSVRDEGSGAGQIGLSGGNVFFGGVVIGTLAGGSGATLTITFNAAATPAAIDALIQNLTYANSSDTPTASRDLVLSITDAAGNDLSGAPSFTERTGAANPFNGVDVGFRSAPTLADLDGDGDLDALVGEVNGTLFYFENTGTALAPVFAQRTGAANPFNGVDVGGVSKPSFADIDGDGDLDAVVGERYGTLFYFENTGTALAPVFTPRTGAASPFNGLDVGNFRTPTFADLNGDGDLDAVVGDTNGTLLYFENIGTVTAPVFIERTGAQNPLSGVQVAALSAPHFADLDGDGDLDALVGENYGTLFYFENTGTAAAPVFTQRTGMANPFSGVDLSHESLPALADLDGDGDLDALVGEDDGTLHYFENTTVRGQTVTVNVTAEPEPEPGPPVLTDFAPSITFAENTVNATPQLLDGDVTFTDSDGDYDGGILTLSGLLAEDTVSVRNQGSGAGQIGLSGANVSYGGVVIGTLAGGAGATLTITFNAAATEAAIDALIQNLTYANVSDTPTASRDLLINITDAAGNDLSGAASFTEQTGAANPFDGLILGDFVAPTFADLDGDGDFDAIVGERYGALLYFENTGTASAPAFVQRTGAANPFDGFDAGYLSAPGVADLDGDGDLDVLLGSNSQFLSYIENTGTGFVERTGASNPFDGIDLGRYVSTNFADLDQDGDLDLMVGLFHEGFRYFENTGSGYAERSGVDNPFSNFNGSDYYYTSASFHDFDHDGDLDAVIGEFEGRLLYLENTGAGFVQRHNADNPFNNLDPGFFSRPAFVDLDNDGNADLVMGFVVPAGTSGRLHYFRDTAIAGQTITVTVTAETDAPEATGLPTDVTVTEDVASDLGLSSVTVTDVDTAGDITVVLTASAGTMTATSGGGVSVTGSGTGTLTLTGTAAAIDAFLNTASAIQYTGALNASGDDAATVTITADDGSGAVTLGVVNVDITAVDDPMSLTDFGPTATFAENTVNATPQLLDADVAFTDDNSDYDGGFLTLSGLLAEDTVSVRNQGSGAGQIGLSGTNVSYGGVVIGTLAGGAGATLTITFHAAATSEAVDALIQNLTYANSSDTPTASRDLVINVTDAAGNDLGPVDALTFSPRAGAASPFNGVDTGFNSTPTFADLDGDGDLDALVGEEDGDLNYFENVGTAAVPVFTQRTGAANPFNGVDVGFDSRPAFVDLDGDGDLDEVVGVNLGTLLYFENIGTVAAPVFSQRTGVANPFNGVDVGADSAPALADLDGDGDLDAVVGENTDVLNYFENTGTSAAPVFTQRTGAANPFNGIDVGAISTAAFADLDGDGDLDAVVGESGGALLYFENTGAAATPLFTARTGAANPFNGVDVGDLSSPIFADLDSDGDLDAVIGEFAGVLNYFENTTVRGQTITVTVTAEEEVIVLTGDVGNDLLEGGAGDDVLTGGGGNDTLSGLGGNDLLQGGSGNDLLNGGDGIDTGNYSDAASAVTVNLAITGRGQDTRGSGRDTLSGIENLAGSAFRDYFTGDAGNNVLSDTLGGNDRFIGGAGNDTLSVERSGGGAATDVTLTGGIGDDTMTFDGTGRYTDTVVFEGQDGADVVTTAGAFRSNINTGAGNDTVTVDTLGGSFVVKLGSGTDTLILADTDGGFAASTANIVRDFVAGAGGDIVDLTAYLAGGALTNFTPGDNPFLDGHMRLVQAGEDTLVQIDRDGGSNGFVTVLTLQKTLASSFTAFNFNGLAPLPAPVEGRAGVDSLTGTEGIDVLNGNGGNDSLVGLAGADVLNGGAGNDVLDGGDGDDVLNGGSGGQGDTATYATASAGVNVNLGLLGLQNTGGSGFDSLTGIEHLVGSAFTDELRGDAAANQLTDTLGGNDFLRGEAGNDTLLITRSGGGAATTVRLNGGADDDALTFTGNGRFTDTVTLEGEAGNDVITVSGALTIGIDAGAGDDTIIYDTLGGVHRMTLGTGVDTVRLAGTGGQFQASGDNLVRDFTTGVGGDIVDLTAYLAGGALTNYTGGDNPFGDGHMRLIQSGSRTLLQVDRDGGGNGYQTVLAFAGTTVANFTTANFNGIDPSGLTPFPPESEGKDGDAGPQVWVQETYDKALMPEVLPGAGDEARDGLGDIGPIPGLFSGGADPRTPLTVDEAGDGFLTVTGDLDRDEATPLVLPGEQADDLPELADPFTWTQVDGAGPSALTVGEDGMLLAGSGPGDQGRDGWLF